MTENAAAVVNGRMISFHAGLSYEELCILLSPKDITILLAWCSNDFATCERLDYCPAGSSYKAMIILQTLERCAEESVQIVSIRNDDL